jgi:hypothetical protein
MKVGLPFNNLSDPFGYIKHVTVKRKKPLDVVEVITRTIEELR